VGFDNWFTFNNAWEFNVTELGNSEHGDATLTVHGTMDRENSKITGTWILKVENCCSNSGRWYANKRGG
jgi:hypothetical protein